jgi:pyrimidine deaminase RibD-like protein
MSRKQQRLLRLLAATAALAIPAHKHAAAIVRNGKILALTCNTIYHHAEEVALHSLKHWRWLARCELYVLRLPCRESRPCRDCCTLIRLSGIGRVWWTSDHGLHSVLGSDLFSTHVSLGRQNLVGTTIRAKVSRYVKYLKTL